MSLVNPQSKVNLIANDFLVHAKNTFLIDQNMDDFISACHRPLRKSIRVNQLKISVKDFVKKLDQYQISYTPIPWCDEGFWLAEGTISLGNLSEHLQGLFYIQEASSMLPPTALLADYIKTDAHDKKEGDVILSPMILDLAAAPGSKTTQIAALINNQGLILANELSASRVKVLHANLMRCGVLNTCISQFDGRKLKDRLSGMFDFVLLDAPCGGEGTVRKDIKALKNWKLSQVQEIAKLQKELILTAYQCLKPGGRLVYSTCTLSPEENQQVANYLQSETDAKIKPLNHLFNGAEKSLTKEGYLHVLPHIYDSEGFFVAAFNKPNNSAITYYQADQKTPFEKISKKTLVRVLDYYKNHFSIDLSLMKEQFKQRDKEVWLFPSQFDAISGLVRLNRSGIKVAEMYPNKLRTNHDFSMCFSHQIKKQIVELVTAQAESFYQGKDLHLDEHEINDGEVVLKFNNHVIGLGTLQKNKIKNQLPRDLVRDKAKF